MRIKAGVIAALCAIMFAGAPMAQDNETPPWVHSFEPAEVVYVSPEGGGRGRTPDSPISIEQAIEGGRAGYMFICLPGSYEGDFELSGEGTQERPIVFRAMPGERVTIKGTVQMGGSYNWLWGFEVTDPRYESHPIQARGPGVHIINNIIHNAGGGIGGWDTGADHVYYGNIVCHVGGDVETRGERRTNYPTYTQNNFNRHGHKYFIQNMFLDGRPFNPSYNFHGYTEGGHISGFYLVGNIMENGRFLIGGYNEPHHNNILERNYFFNMPQVQFGYRRPIQVEFRDNYLGRSTLSIPYMWGIPGEGREGVTKPKPSIYTGNTIINPPGAHVDIISFSYLPDVDNRGGSKLDPDDVFDENIYSANFQGNLNSAGNRGGYGLDGWRDASEAAGNRFDENAEEIPAPEEPFVAVTVNEYEPGRGHMVIFNWGGDEAVEADLSDIVEEGAAFTVHRARRAFDDPVAEGTYEGPVAIPMNGKEFDAFLVRVAQ